MNYLWAFAVGGGICVVGQLLIDYTKLTPARILTGYVVAGVILSAVGLIVTVTFAILTMISIVAALMICNPLLYALTLLFLVLLFPYIMHYYPLENEVQKI